MAIVGAGKIGRHRARLAAAHAGVAFLAIVDVDAEAAERLANEVGAHLWSTDIDAVINMDEISGVVVSTHEAGHVEPVLAAIRAGHATLVEKPIALTIDGADAMVEAAAEFGVDLRVGYSMRYAQRYAVGHQQMVDRKIGSIIGGMARCYDTLAVARAILARSPGATPAADILTYLIDIVDWYHTAVPVHVVARGNGTLLRAEGHEADDITVALVDYDDGSVISFGTSYSLPTGYPINGMATRIELLGTEGVLLLTEDHGDQVMYTESGYSNAYVDQTTNLTYLGSRTSGEWVGNTMFGRVADETRAWLDHLSTGTPCHITTAKEARRTLAVTLAIDESAKTGRRVPVE